MILRPGIPSCGADWLGPLTSRWAPRSEQNLWVIERLTAGLRKGWDAAAASALSAALGAGVIVPTNGLDTLAALRASRVKQPFLILPPWFPDDTVKAAIRYYSEHGFEPAAHLRVDPGRKWRGLPPGGLTSHGMGVEQGGEPPYAPIRAACPPQADRGLVSGAALLLGANPLG